MANILSQVKNYLFPTPDNPLTAERVGDWRAEKNPEKNLRSYITPVQLQRIRQDVQSWREAIAEAEQAWYPHRVKMQRMFLDTILNGHVAACLSRRKNLTLLKEFMLCDNETHEEDEQWTKIIKKSWFNLYCNYVLDAQFFGYSLISLGDLVNDEFPKLTTIRRFNVSPDRMNVTSYVYSLSGAQFNDEPYKEWNVYQPTPTDVGISLCGYGLLYKVAMYEIICRNTLGYNMDAAEMYGMPIRKGKTMKTNEDERALFERALAQMGSAGYILMDTMDELELVESSQSGAGFKVYESLEKRCEQKISKILLGHADALDSTSGKLGATQGEDSPVASALEEVQIIDSRVLENNINTELLPRLRQMGIAIPDNLCFMIKNDQERAEQRTREDNSNQVTANIAQTMKNAGLQMDAAYFEERTGIPTEIITAPAPAPAEIGSVSARLKRLYNKG
jgi:hypothetical protein